MPNVPMAFASPLGVPRALTSATAAAIAQANLSDRLVQKPDLVVDPADWLAKDDQACAPPSLRTYLVHESPRLAVVPNFLTDSEVAHLLELARQSWAPSEVDDIVDERQPHAVAAQGILRRSAKHRTSDSYVLEEGQTETLRQIEKRLCHLVGMKLETLERLAMVKYAPGQFFKVHHDGGYRPWTVFVYLNDLPAGAEGETHFPALQLRVTPRKGCAVMWPNSGPDGKADPRLVHQGLPPTTGMKFGVNCFFHEKPVRRPALPCDEETDHTEEELEDEDSAQLGWNLCS
ncbi:unnamed protein product [Polarella glacialis]|uniref:Prolyl 4-hydroxylase alpha subunit domain-containing protein n=1 Tax=Polarella glacialis TaxID=89957 RepID=A0A813KJF9_POLGL|nr:unnamed protein product [Polarella glacialis]